MQLKALIESWLLSRQLHTFYPPATESHIQSVEAEIGYRLPLGLRELYSFSNGPLLLNNNLNLYPLKKSDDRWAGLSDLSAQLRGWKWLIPDEVLTFADSGSESYFAIWIPETYNQTFRNPVIEIGEGHEKCLSIVGTNFIPFLLSWTAYYLLYFEAESVALDALDLPHSLRDRPLDEELFADLRRWADPLLPDPYPDPYRKGHTAEELRKMFDVQK